jgi:transposase
MRNLVSDLWAEWKGLDQRIKASDLEVEQIATCDPACQRLRSIPGIGPLIATAIVAAIGTEPLFAREGSSQPSWALFHDSTLPAARHA